MRSRCVWYRVCRATTRRTVRRFAPRFRRPIRRPARAYSSSAFASPVSHRADSRSAPEATAPVRRPWCGKTSKRRRRSSTTARQTARSRASSATSTPATRTYRTSTETSFSETSRCRRCRSRTSRNRPRRACGPSCATSARTRAAVVTFWRSRTTPISATASCSCPRMPTPVRSRPVTPPNERRWSRWSRCISTRANPSATRCCRQAMNSAASRSGRPIESACRPASSVHSFPREDPSSATP